jgi:hypothetical protein
MLEQCLGTDKVCACIGFEIESAHLQYAKKASQVALSRLITSSSDPGLSNDTEKCRKGLPFVPVHGRRV